MKFIDLFAGLGGFHSGLSRIGMNCVFSSEIDPMLRKLYQTNFGLLPVGDIRKVEAKFIPKHDILCAGFPCQPFSRAGKKVGAACPSSGKLIDDVLRIASYHKPKYILLENVPSILTISQGVFWQYICTSFKNIGYSIEYKIYSPHQFGIPQKRNRIFVVMSKSNLDKFEWPSLEGVRSKKLSEIIDPKSDNIRTIEPEKLKCLEGWQKLVVRLRSVKADPILSTEFGATYPIEGIRQLTLKEAKLFKGAFGADLSSSKTWKELLSKMPHYIKDNGGVSPLWMRSFIKQSRETYRSDQKFIDLWKLDFIGLPNSWQKLEWQSDRDVMDIWKNNIQFRASGIRIIRPDTAPSLVAMTPTQTPIIGAERRYMSVREAAVLQSLESLKEFPENNTKAFKALGNAINAHIISRIASNLTH